jgi:hypothetical protein
MFLLAHRERAARLGEPAASLGERGEGLEAEKRVAPALALVAAPFHNPSPFSPKLAFGFAKAQSPLPMGEAANLRSPVVDAGAGG